MAFRDYKDMVDSYLRDNSMEVFGNFSGEHAGYIISRFLETAEFSVDIFSGSFFDAFYSERGIDALLVQTINRLQKVNGKIRIITISGQKNDLLERLQKDSENKDTFLYVPAKYVGNQEDLQHFMIVDNMRYRLEAPHPAFGANNRPDCIHAEVCCNGKKKAAELTSFFKQVLDAIEPNRNRLKNA